MNRTVILLTLAVAALFAVPGQASASTPDTTAPCPGPAGQAIAREAMFCAGNFPARADGPFFVNYVDEVDGRQQFCSLDRTLPTESAACHPYWPFVNPTVNAYLAPKAAFTPDRLVATQGQVDELRATTTQQD